VHFEITRALDKQCTLKFGSLFIVTYYMFSRNQIATVDNLRNYVEVY